MILEKLRIWHTRKNISIILLDEPSSALDVESEKKINLAMKKLMDNKIVIINQYSLNTFHENFLISFKDYLIIAMII